MENKPQFPAEEVTLPSKGLLYPENSSIRSGKIFILEIESESEEKANSVAENISDKLLSNPIIEKFSYNLI